MPASTPTTTTTALNPQTYGDCINEAGADAKRFGSCAALLTRTTCRQLLRIVSGSVPCATAMTLANAALLLSLQTGSVGYIHIGPWECYAGDQSTDCTYGRTEFIAQTDASSSSTNSGAATSTSSTVGPQSTPTATCSPLTDGEGGGEEFTEVSGATCGQADAVAHAWVSATSQCGTGLTSNCVVAGFNCTATQQGPGRTVACVDGDKKVDFNAM